MTRPRHHADDIADALARAIVENPHNKLPRLVLADRFDEIGEPERAEFIRLDCEPGGIGEADARRLCHRLNFDNWFGDLYAAGCVTVTIGRWHEANQLTSWRAVVRDGMAADIRMSLGGWTGGPCGACDGGGFIRHGDGEDDVHDCSHCHGTGTTPGHGADVVSRHPVTRVVVTDREPDLIGEEVCWIEYRRDLHGNINTLPTTVFDAMSHGGRLEEAGTEWQERVGYTDRWVVYPTREAAVEALSRALVDLARSRAGLPKINWEVSQ